MSVRKTEEGKRAVTNERIKKPKPVSVNNKAVPERCDLTLMSGSICLTLNVVLDPVNIFHDGSTRTELKSRSGLKLAEWIKKICVVMS